MNTTDITKENIFQDIDFKELAKTYGHWGGQSPP